MGVFVVERWQRGPGWIRGRPMEEQPRWAEHAAFMNDLVDRGLVVLGGPVGSDGRVIQIMRASSEEEIRATLGGDPWSPGLLVEGSIEPWTIRLGELP